VKRNIALHWLIAIAIAVMAIALAFYFDEAVREFMARHQNRALRDFMRYVSFFGDWPSHVALGLLLLGIAWWRGRKVWMRIFLAMLVAMAIAGVAGHIIKRSVPRARPSVKSELRWGGPRFSSKYHSFPSGHVGASTAFFGVLVIARRRVGLACLTIPIVIGFSRMYIGAHYLSDVVCAGVLGFLCALIVSRLMFQLSQPETSNVQISASNNTLV
jgi:membrane-associated phospholipid phosphatase